MILRLFITAFLAIILLLLTTSMPVESASPATAPNDHPGASFVNLDMKIPGHPVHFRVNGHKDDTMAWGCSGVGESVEIVEQYTRTVKLKCVTGESN